MSAQLDRIEEKLDRLLAHLGAGLPIPARQYLEPPPEEQTALEKYAEEHKKATHAALNKLFDENTDELTDLGQKVLPDAWMGDGVTPK